MEPKEPEEIREMHEEHELVEEYDEQRLKECGIATFIIFIVAAFAWAAFKGCGNG